MSFLKLGKGGDLRLNNNLVATRPHGFTRNSGFDDCGMSALKRGKLNRGLLHGFTQNSSFDECGMSALKLGKLVKA